MIKLKQAVIVEGKYDKIRLSNIIDAVIVQVNGFSLYKDRETLAFIRTLAEKTGIIILTDSDSAGLQLRRRIKEAAGSGSVTHVYIPEIAGKEKRKSQPSKQGLLGVEGVSDDVLLEAFGKAGVLAEKTKARALPITKADLLELGLVGGENSAKRRAALLGKLGLPTRLSANMLLDVLNVMYKREDFLEEFKEWYFQA